MKTLQSFFFAAFGLLTVAGAFGQSSDLIADQIILRMTKVYSSAKTYQETGSVSLVKDINTFKGKAWEDVLLTEDIEKVENVTFSFQYQRPSRLRFEWSDEQSKVKRPSVVWSNGESAYSWRTSYDENKDVFIWDKESSLKWAIDEETRGSMSVADILYNALNGSKEFYSFSEMKQARIVREELIGGHPCFVIIGYISRDPWVLWIDKENFVLRRYRMQIATGSFDESVRTGFMPATLGEVNHDNIQVDVGIPSSTFNFKPTLRKGDIDISKYKKEQLIAPPPPLPRKPQDFQ
jgi:outer membrane lipoprotein-sorting protein